MRKITLLLLSLITLACSNQKQAQIEESSTTPKGKIYDYVVKDIDGKDFNFADLKGKKIMVVNTASKCGLTPQYEQLEDIYEKYKDNNFIVVGFPANNFMGQEPGTNKEIKQFCSANFDVSFPMMSKISVKSDDMAPIYKFLTNKSKNGVSDNQVEWNFQKYLIGEDGTLEKVFYPKTKPNDPEIIAWIEE